MDEAGEYSDIDEIKGGNEGKKGKRSASSTLVRIYLASLTISIFANVFLTIVVINRPNREDWQKIVDSKTDENKRQEKEIDFWKAQTAEWKYYAVKGLKEIQPQVTQTKEKLDSVLIDKN